jgi:photosystem II stability/assembly factor-like uncharacterized protein
MSDEKKALPRAVSSDDLKRLAWRNIGPAIMGGRVAALAFAPGNTKTFYVGYATGGVWKTENRGITFKPLFDSEVTSSIGSLGVVDAGPTWPGWTAQDKKAKSKKELAEAGKGKVVWVGTGEGNGRNSSSWGNGVYRSTDAGASWTHLGLENTHDIPALAVDPNDPDTCYVAALGHLWGENPERGVYKTSDGGKTWQHVLKIDTKTGACDVALDPSDSNIVFAAMTMRRRTPFSYQSGGPEGGIYRSTDAGKTWKKLTKGLPSQTGRIGLAIYPKNPKILVAVVQSHDGGASDIRDDRSRSGGVFRSDDGGDSWTRLSHRSPRAFYFSRIYFDPNDDQKVIMIGWNIEVSDDGGKTFRGGIGEKNHVDHHALLIDPDDSSHWVNGNDGGVYQTFDAGKSWQFFNTHAVGQFYNVAVDDLDPYRVAGGLQDNGTWMLPSATALEEDKWKDGTTKAGITNADVRFILWGDGFRAAFDPTDPNIVYGEWQGGNLTRVHFDSPRKVIVQPQQQEGGPRFRFNWNSPFFVSPHHPTTLYLAGNTVFRLTDRGDRNEEISPDLTTNDPNKMDRVGSSAEQYCTIVSLAESVLKPGLIWAGSDDGLIHVTTDGGKRWNAVTPPQVQGLYVARICPSHHVEGRAYVAVDGHRSDVFKPLILVTDDFGESWSEITSDLPAGGGSKTILEDRFSPDVLYVGTERGFFVSVDRGKSWHKGHGSGLPTVPIDDIVQHPRETDLILGTHGRSIWILDDASFMAQLTPDAVSKDLHVFTPRPAKPRRMGHYAGIWTDQAFRAENPPFGARFHYWIREYQSEEVSIKITNRKGIEVAKLSGNNAPGVHRVVWDCVPLEHFRLADQGEGPFDTFFVPAGEYTATFSYGKTKVEMPFTVESVR